MTKKLIKPIVMRFEKSIDRKRNKDYIVVGDKTCELFAEVETNFDGQICVHLSKRNGHLAQYTRQEAKMICEWLQQAIYEKAEREERQ